MREKRGNRKGGSCKDTRVDREERGLRDKAWGGGGRISPEVMVGEQCMIQEGGLER